MLILSVKLTDIYFNFKINWYLSCNEHVEAANSVWNQFTRIKSYAPKFLVRGIQRVARRFGPMSLRPPDIPNPTLFDPRTFRHWTFRPTFWPWFGPRQIKTYFDNVYYFLLDTFSVRLLEILYPGNIRNQENSYSIYKFSGKFKPLVRIIQRICSYI